ncbi:DHH family phosphoesterase [Reichenbachiella sp.]|uniref:DHH family phosphoesterase n=1 Tax=Reichenbachiella sp. TaxID=2184521 RepID=UPI003B5AB4A6
MNIYEQIVAEIQSAKHMVITSHKSPDGDSIGSSLGLLRFIEKLGQTAIVCHPDKAPDSLEWVGLEPILLMTDQSNEVTKAFEKADLIFCLDYNGTDRIGPDMQALLEAATCKKVMIDHHLNPQDFAALMVSETSSSSTAQLIAELVVQSGHEDLLDAHIGTPLYLGILTDTGTFRFPAVEPRTHELIAKLLAAGVEHHLIHEVLNDNNTADRLRLQGFAMAEKLEILEDYHVAIIPLTKEELAKYNYKKGDTDALANLALSIKGMKAAVMIAERDGIVKMSFRSKGEENPVNTLAADHFDGGGHANAAGGMCKESVDETVKKLKQIIPDYFLNS